MQLKLEQVGPRKLEVTGENWTFHVDLREQFGGENSAPNPSELAAAAVASCEVLTGIFWASQRHGIELRNVHAEVKWEYAEKPDRISKIEVSIKNVMAQLGEATRAFKGVAKGCTISKTLAIPPELTLKVE